MRTGNTYRDVWTLRPGTQTLNLWGYRVFRYAEVIGADPDGRSRRRRSCTRTTRPRRRWSSSSAALDQVVDFNRDGVRELNLDLHLDSPSRERAPYEGDNLIHMLIQGYTDGDWTLSKYTLQWLAVNETWPTEWRFSSILSALRVLAGDGRPKAVARLLRGLKAFVPTRWIRASDGLVQKEPGASSHRQRRPRRLAPGRARRLRLHQRQHGHQRVVLQGAGRHGADRRGAGQDRGRRHLGRGRRAAARRDQREPVRPERPLQGRPDDDARLRPRVGVRRGHGRRRARSSSARPRSTSPTAAWPARSSARTS